MGKEMDEKLTDACSRNYYHITEALLKNGVKISDNALCSALLKGNIEIVKLLINYGANIILIITSM